MVAEYSQPQRERSEAYSGGAGKLADRVEQKEHGRLEDSLQEETTDQENNRPGGPRQHQAPGLLESPLLSIL